jgi:hypothetical protein
MIDPDLRRKIQAVIDAVTQDDVGRMVAGQYRGGGGGLLSQDTIRAVDALRAALAREDARPAS